MFDPAMLYLSSNGDSFNLRISDLGDKIHPKLQEATACKTYQAILKFLEGVADDKQFLSSVHLYHLHNREYPEHTLEGIYKGAAHEDTIQQMICFVKQRIEDTRYVFT